LIALSISNLPVISVRVQKTQKQWRKICGYFECVFATALSFGIDFQSKVFGIDQLISFWIEIIQDRRVTLFSYGVKEKVNNTKHQIVRYVRVFCKS